MTVFALVNQKGGVGKSSTAIALAYYLSRVKGCSTLLIDADAQQSISLWAKQVGLDCQVIGDPDDLFEQVPELADEYDHIVIDGPGAVREIIRSILDRADVALIPSQAGALDLSSSSLAVRQVRKVKELRGGKPAAWFFLSRVFKATILTREALDFLKAEFPDIPLAVQAICQRQCIADSAGQGLTVWEMRDRAAKEAAADYANLFEEILCPENL